MADHQHVEMLVYRVNRVRARGISARRQHIGLAAGLDDVRCMTSAGTFGVIGVDSAPLECGQGIFDETRFIQRVSVYRHLHVMLLGDIETVVDGRGRGSPIFVQFQPHRPSEDLLVQGRGQTGVTLAEKT